MDSDHSWYDWPDMNCFVQVKWKDAHWQKERKMQSVIKKLGVKTHWRQKPLSHVNSGQHQKNQMGLISSMSSFTHVAIIRNGPRALCAHVGNSLGELRWAKAASLYRARQLDRYQLFSTFYRQIIDLHLEKNSSIITSIKRPSMLKEIKGVLRRKIIFAIKYTANLTRTDVLYLWKNDCNSILKYNSMILLARKLLLVCCFFFATHFLGFLTFTLELILTLWKMSVGKSMIMVEGEEILKVSISRKG